MSFTSYQVDNDKKFRDSLAEASKHIQDMRSAFGLISADFYKSQQAMFKLKGPGQFPEFKNSVRASSIGGEGNPNGRKRATYDVSKSAYQRRKLKKYGFDYPLLVASGSLSRSVLGPNNPGSINKATNLSLSIGTTLKYGVYHQSDQPRKKMPLRKFLFIGPEASQFATSEQMGRLGRWLKIVETHVQKQLDKMEKA